MSGSRALELGVFGLQGLEGLQGHEACYLVYSELCILCHAPTDGMLSALH